MGDKKDGLYKERNYFEQKTGIAHLVSEEALDTLLKQMLANVGVNSRERVIKKICGCPPVARPGQGHPGLLTARQGHTTFSNQRGVPMFPLAEVVRKSARLDHFPVPEEMFKKKSKNFPVPLLLKGLPEQDVGTHRATEDPSFLWRIRETSSHRHRSTRGWKFSEDRLKHNH